MRYPAGTVFGPVAGSQVGAAPLRTNDGDSSYVELVSPMTLSGGFEAYIDPIPATGTPPRVGSLIPAVTPTDYQAVLAARWGPTYAGSFTTFFRFGVYWPDAGFGSPFSIDVLQPAPDPTYGVPSAVIPADRNGYVEYVMPLYFARTGLTDAQVRTYLSTPTPSPFTGGAPYGQPAVTVFSANMFASADLAFFRLTYLALQVQVAGIPPLRQFPRDDALVGRGSPRQIPRTGRSVQSTVRQGWHGTYR